MCDSASAVPENRCQVDQCRKSHVGRLTLLVAQVAWLCWGNCASTARADADAADVSLQYLSEHGYKIPDNANSEQLRSVLQPLLIDKEALAKTRRYLEELGADEYAKREAASRGLAKLKVPIDVLLNRFESGKRADDLEYSWRLQQIRAVRRSLGLEDHLFHALRVIAGRGVKGLTAELLSTAEALEGGDARMVEAVEHAVSVSVSADDLDLLYSLAAEDQSMNTRRRATVALARLLARMGKGGELRSLLMTQEEKLRLAAARGAILGQSALGVPALVELLESRNVEFRCRAIALLEGSVGETFGYAGYDPDGARSKSTARWRKWLTAGQLPELTGTSSGAGDTGRVLVGIQLNEEADEKAERRRGKPVLRSSVVEFTPSGSLRWRMQSAALRGGTPVGAIPLNHGKKAIAFGKSGEVLQHSLTIRFFDHHHQLLGSISGAAGIGSISHHEDNLLLAAGNEIIEVGVLGNVGRRTPLENVQAIDFFSVLRGDRYLVVSTNDGKVQEYSQEGELLWSLENLSQPIFARRLNSGRLIVGFAKGSDEDENANPAIALYSAAGNQMWEFVPTQEMGHPNSIASLSNGSALLGTRSGLYEIGANGRVSRTWINGAVTFVCAD